MQLFHNRTPASHGAGCETIPCQYKGQYGHILMLSDGSIISLQLNIFQKQGHLEKMQKPRHITHCSWAQKNKWCGSVYTRLDWAESRPSMHSVVRMRRSLQWISLPPPTSHPPTFNMKMAKGSVTVKNHKPVILMNFLVKDSSRHMEEFYFASDLLPLNTLFHSRNISR